MEFMYVLPHPAIFIPLRSLHKTPHSGESRNPETFPPYSFPYATSTRPPFRRKPESRNVPATFIPLRGLHKTPHSGESRNPETFPPYSFPYATSTRPPFRRKPESRNVPATFIPLRGLHKTPIPAKAGIQRRCGTERNWLATFLDSGFRRNGGSWVAPCRGLMFRRRRGLGLRRRRGFMFRRCRYGPAFQFSPLVLWAGREYTLQRYAVT